MVTAVVNETVMAVRDFIYRGMTPDKSGTRGRPETVSAEKIVAFLGSNWSIDRVKDAIEAIMDPEVAQKAIGRLAMVATVFPGQRLSLRDQT